MVFRKGKESVRALEVLRVSREESLRASKV